MIPKQPAHISSIPGQHHASLLKMIIMKKYNPFKILLPVIFIAVSAHVSAQATRTWVSGVGDDVNPCSRTAPCKTFAGAISKTAAGGEINALDPGGMGAVTISKSMTIDGRGTFASILASLTSGININAGPDGIVILRNLSIDGAGNGISGIRIISAKKVFIEHCTIFNFTKQGIEIATVTPCNVFMHDVVIENAEDGLSMASEGGRVIAEDCRFQGMTNNGINVISGRVNLNRSGIADCNTGILTATNTSVALSGNMIINNETALQGKGTFTSIGNNSMTGNRNQGISATVSKMQ